MLPVAFSWELLDNIVYTGVNSSNKGRGEHTLDFCIDFSGSTAVLQVPICNCIEKEDREMLLYHCFNVCTPVLSKQVGQILSTKMCLFCESLTCKYIAHVYMVCVEIWRCSPWLIKDLFYWCLIYKDLFHNNHTILKI